MGYFTNSTFCSVVPWPLTKPIKATANNGSKIVRGVTESSFLQAVAWISNFYVASGDESIPIRIARKRQTIGTPSRAAPSFARHRRRLQWPYLYGRSDRQGEECSEVLIQKVTCPLSQSDR